MRYFLVWRLQHCYNLVYSKMGYVHLHTVEISQPLPYPCPWKNPKNSTKTAHLRIVIRRNGQMYGKHSVQIWNLTKILQVKLARVQILPNRIIRKVSIPNWSFLLHSSLYKIYIKINAYFFKFVFCIPLILFEALVRDIALHLLMK